MSKKAVSIGMEMRVLQRKYKRAPDDVLFQADLISALRQIAISLREDSAPTDPLFEHYEDFIAHLNDCYGDIAIAEPSSCTHPITIGDAIREFRRKLP